MSPEDWTRFNACAAQVIRLDFDSGLEVSELKTAKKLLEGAPLCPNLRYISIYMETLEPNDDFPWADIFRVLLPSTLRTAEIVQGEYFSDDKLEVVIATLASLIPSLEELRLMTFMANVDYGAFKQMRKVAIQGELDHVGWRALATCPALETIETRDGPHIGGTILGYHDPEPYEACFPRLKSLNINDEDENKYPEFIRDIFRYSKMPQLEHLTVHVGGDLDRDTIRESLRKGYPRLKTVRWEEDEEEDLAD